MNISAASGISDLLTVKQAASLMMSKKANDHARQQGDAAISLLKAAADIARQTPSPSSGGVDTYA